MTEQKDFLSDEAINGVVSMIEVAEVLAKVMNMTVSQSFFFMLKSAQIHQQRGKSMDFSNIMSVTKRIQ